MGIFGGMKKPMGDPLAALGGYDQQAAFMGQSGFAPMNQMQPQKKPGFFSKNGGWRDLAGAFGDAFSPRGPMYFPMKQEQENREQTMLQRQQMAEQQRQQEREDFIWKSQYERDNPKPTNPYRWESNDGSLLELGPDGQPRVVYKDPTPKVSYQRVENGDGTFTMVPVVNGQIMTGGAQQPTPTAPVGKLRPLGGGVGNGTSGF